MKNQNENNGGRNESSQESSAHERLCAHLFGELDASEAARLEADLADSEELRGERERLEATIGLLQSSTSGGDALSPEILATLEQASKPVLRITPWYTRTPMRAAAGFLALAAGVIGGNALMEESSERESSSVNAPSTEMAKRDGSQDAAGAVPEALVDGFGQTTGLAQVAEPGDQDADAERLSFSTPVHDLIAGREDSAKQQKVEVGARLGILEDRKKKADGQPSAGSASHGGTYKGPGDSRPPSKRGVSFYSEPSGKQLEAGAVVLESTVLGLDELRLPTDQEAPYMRSFETQSAGQAGSINTLTLGKGVADNPQASAGFPVGGVDGKSSTTGSNDVKLVRANKTTLHDAGNAWNLRYGAGAKNAPPAESPVVVNERARRKAGRLISGGGGGGPTSPGAPASSGPSSPGPSGLANPSPPLPTSKRELSLDAGEYKGGGSDDFFLGHGQAPARRRTPEDIDAYCKQQTRVILDSCLRRKDEKPSDMFFRFWGDNAFELTRLDSQSTFSVDVDTASYTLARRYLQRGNLPTKAQIRTEEFVNYFKPDVAPPTEGVFNIQTELAESRFGNDSGAPSHRWMMRVGIRGREVAKEERKPLALTFVVDTSGSMKDGRLELVKHAIRLLVSQMDGADSMAIVGFNNSASIILPMTSSQNRGVIEAAIYGLSAAGGTNAEGGLRLGYEVASAGLSPQSHNRVVLLSDGVANIGQTDQDRINGDVKRHRESGIFLNTIGVGMSNHNDAFLEQLANKGDGICNYVDSAVEARRALVENFMGAFEPIARDVKIQVDFDQSQVYRYRLLGYENRAIADADFRNDAVDAGEVGAGHQVVALFELEMTGQQSTEPMARVNLRYKEPTGAGRDPREDSAIEISKAVSFDSATAWSGSSMGYKRSVLVAQFAEILRRSVHASGDSLDDLIQETVQLAGQMQDSDVIEFLTLLQTSHDLIRNQARHHDDLSLCIDEIRRNKILRAQLEELRQTENLEVLAELERANDELEDRIRELIRRELIKEQK